MIHKTVFFRFAFLLIPFFGLPYRGSSQIPAAADSVKAQASRMGNAFATGDFKTFIHYMHPKIVEMAGGVDGLKNILSQASRQMSTAGMSIDAITIDSMTHILKAGTSLQTTVQQHSAYKVPDGRTIATTTLIGLSADNGLHWKFVDTHNKTIEDVRKVLPNVSPALTIPPAYPPVHFDH